MAVLDNFFIYVIVLLFPFDNQLPTLNGYSTLFIYFAFLSIYILLFRGNKFLVVVNNSISKYLIFFIIICFFVEFFHSSSRYIFIQRTFNMILGALFFATLLDKKQSMTPLLYGLITNGAIISYLGYTGLFKSLSTAGSNYSFFEATDFRLNVMDTSNFVQENLNRISNYIGLSGIITLIAGINTKAKYKKMFLYIVSLICLFTLFLPMSRSGVLIVFLTVLFVLFKFKKLKKTIFLLIIFSAIIINFVPDIVFSRFYGTLDILNAVDNFYEVRDSRVRLIDSFSFHFWDAFPFGVGEGNYWGDWGKRSLFSTWRGVFGAHNIFAQIYFHWGLICLLIWLIIFGKTYQLIFNIHLKDNLNSNIAAAFFIYSLLLCFFTHNMYLKIYSICFGYIISYSCFSKPRLKTVGN
tara:strand:- start:9466 stop:10692 length:1227 start_codon:yes stop_codon:yes gene_type:complete